MRELEVLYDQLLDLFRREPELGPAQVMALTPDIDACAPYTQAAFGEPGDRPPGCLLALREALWGSLA